MVTVACLLCLGNIVVHDRSLGTAQCKNGLLVFPQIIGAKAGGTQVVLNWYPGGSQVA